jgi:UPF0716 protein FxsA
MTFRRLPLVICSVVVLDMLLLGTLWYAFHWSLPLASTVTTTIVGLIVIGYYELRWSESVARSLEQEPGLLDRLSLERILLLVAGVILLIPGVMTDVLGLLLILPPVRRFVAGHCPLRKQ